MVGGAGVEVPGVSALAMGLSVLPWAEGGGFWAGAAFGCAAEGSGAALTGCGAAAAVGACPDAALGAVVLEAGTAPSPFTELCTGDVGCGCAGPCAGPPLGSAALTCPFCPEALAALPGGPTEPGSVSAAWDGLEGTAVAGAGFERGGPEAGGTPPVLLEAA